MIEYRAEFSKYDKFFRAKGFAIVAEEWFGTASPFELVCKEGHKSEVVYANAYRDNFVCAQCFAEKRLSEVYKANKSDKNIVGAIQATLLSTFLRENRISNEEVEMYFGIKPKKLHTMLALNSGKSAKVVKAISEVTGSDLSEVSLQVNMVLEQLKEDADKPFELLKDVRVIDKYWGGK